MRRHAGTTWAWLGWVGLAGLFYATVIGCAPQARYEVLSFFFDGVPDPNAPADTGRSLVRRTVTGVTFYIHEPYLQGECSQCHRGERGALMSRASVPENLCMECHAHVPQQHEVMHGPVAANACGMCHAPHRSTVPNLLKEAAPGLCFQCHSPLELDQTVPWHSDPTVDCTSCHSGHGGRERSLLKPAWGPSEGGGAP